MRYIALGRGSLAPHSAVARRRRVARHAWHQRRRTCPFHAAILWSLQQTSRRHHAASLGDSPALFRAGDAGGSRHRGHTLLSSLLPVWLAWKVEPEARPARSIPSPRLHMPRVRDIDGGMARLRARLRLPAILLVATGLLFHTALQSPAPAARLFNPITVITFTATPPDSAGYLSLSEVRYKRRRRGAGQPRLPTPSTSRFSNACGICPESASLRLLRPRRSTESP